MRAKTFFYVSLAVLALTVAFAAAQRTSGGAAFAQAEAAEAPIPAGVSAPIAEQLQREFEAVAARVNPTVVNIDVEKPMDQPAYQFWQGGPNVPPELRDFFRGFPGFPGFEGPQPQQQQQRRGGRRGQPQPVPQMRAAGSGVIIDADNGYILTNNHVVVDTSRVGVTLIDGSKYEAKVVGKDWATDLAVVKIEAKGLKEIEYGDSDALKPGHMVLAFGQPEGLKYTVTQGIVSAIGRSDIGIIANQDGLAGYENFIQTDAAVNPGNSGGPLTDIHGRLVGINTAIATAGLPQWGGISFAVPVNTVKKVVPQLIDKGEVERGWLGVTIAALSDAAEQGVDVKPEEYDTGGRGVYVVETMPEGPAAKSGIKEGDVVVAVDGREIATTTELRNFVADAPVGAKLPVEVVRLVDGKPERMTLDVEVGRQPRDMAAARRQGASGTAIGVVVQTVTPELARALGYEEDLRGAVVTDIVPDSRAAKAGIQADDVITQVRHKGKVHEVTSTETLRAAFDAVPAGEAFAVRVLREGQSQFITVR
jgi:serine protease Do